MATKTVDQRPELRAVASPTPNASPECVAVNGWDIGVVNTQSKTPPVIVNPQATLADLADWARSQLEQASNISEAISCGWIEHGAGLQNAVAAVHHFELQALAVLREVSNRLQDAEVSHG